LKQISLAVPFDLSYASNASLFQPGTPR